MSKILVTCDEYMRDCVVSPYAEPPSHFAEYGFSGTTITWALIVVGVLTLALIIGTAVVRVNLHNERGLTERQRIENPPPECPNCFTKVVA